MGRSKEQTSQSKKAKSTDEEEYLLNGKFLSKSDLKHRIQKMDIELDTLEHNKEYYQEMYNNLVNKKNYRNKIKSILATDIIDRPDKNLNRKRDRDDSGITQLNQEELSSQKKINLENNQNIKKSSKEKIVVQSDFDFTEVTSRNLSLDNLMLKIEKDVNDYKNIYKNIEGGNLSNNKINNINSLNADNLLSFSKEYSDNIANKNIIKNMTGYSFGLAADETVEKGKVENRKTSFKDFPKMKLNYDESINNDYVDNMIYAEENNYSNNYTNQNESKIMQIFKIAPMSSSNNNEENLNPPQEKGSNENINSNISNYYNNIKNYSNKNSDNETVQINTKPSPIQNFNFNQNFNQNLSQSSQFPNLVESMMNTDTIKYQEDSFAMGSINESAIKPPVMRPPSPLPRKTPAGSSKNIQEIINKLEIPQNQNNTIKSKGLRESSNRILDRSNSLTELINRTGLRRTLSANLPQSNKSIVVSIRHQNVSDFITAEKSNLTLKSKTKFPVISKISKAYTYQDYTLLALYSVIGAGLVVLSFYIIQRNELNFNKIYEFVQNLPTAVKLLLISLIVLTFALLIYIKTSNVKFLQQIAEEDYNRIKNLLCNMYKIEDSPIGIFENNFIKDFAKLHNMNEKKYRKNVLPLIIKIRDGKNEIEEKEILIQEQAQNVWDLILNE